MLTAVRPVIRLLGEPLLIGGDGERVAFRTTKVPALLAYLVAREGRPALRTEIAEALWPGRDSGLAHQNLRQTLLYLRGCLGSKGDEALQASRRDVRLRPGFAQCDVQAFRTAIAEGPKGLDEAVSLYRGAFMEGFDDDWLLPVRAELAHAYVRALLHLSDSCLEEDPARALDYAERAIGVEPFHDGARTRKIRALRRSGEEALALREFEAYESLLVEELGLRPARTVEEALADRVPQRVEVRRPEPPPTSGLEDALRVLADGERPQDALALAVSLTPYWVEVGTPVEGLRRLDAVRERHVPEGTLAVKVALAAGELALRASRFDRSLSELEAAQDLVCDAEDVARYFALRARVHLRRREYDLVRRLALHALRFARKHGSSTGDAWFMLAHAHHGDDRSQRSLTAALRAQANSGGSRRLFGLAGIAAAIAYGALGREAEARSSLAGALDAFEGDRSAAVVGARMSAAWQFEAFGELDRAERSYTDAVAECRRRGDSWLLAIALTYLGDLKSRLGEGRLAVESHREALKLRLGTGDVIGEATSRRGLGIAWLTAGDPEAARRELREAVRQYAEVEWDPGLAGCLVALARAEAAVGSRDIARRLALRSVRLLRHMTPAARYSISPEGASLLTEAERLAAELTGTGGTPQPGNDG